MARFRFRGKTCADAGSAPGRKAEGRDLGPGRHWTYCRSTVLPNKAKELEAKYEALRDAHEARLRATCKCFIRAPVSSKFCFDECAGQTAVRVFAESVNAKEDQDSGCFAELMCSAAAIPQEASARMPPAEGTEYGCMQQEADKLHVGM